MTMTTLGSNVDADRLVDEHFERELRGDVTAVVATFSPDVEHDVVGRPSVSRGRDEAGAFYEELFSDLALEDFENVRRYHGPGFVVDESIVHARATGTPFGIPGLDRPLQFRLLHVFELRDGYITRENAWLDVAAILAQLSSKPA
jgi:steroid delta-isomerase-like uncharacterized protein